MPRRAASVLVPAHKSAPTPVFPRAAAVGLAELAELGLQAAEAFNLVARTSTGEGALTELRRAIKGRGEVAPDFTRIQALALETLAGFGLRAAVAFNLLPSTAAGERGLQLLKDALEG